MPLHFETVADFYKVKRLSDLLTEDEITVFSAGFSDRMNLPIIIVERDKEENLKVYKPIRFDEFLHPNCLKARQKQIDMCRKQEDAELREFLNRRYIRPAGFCLDDGIHFRKGIMIGGIPVALAIGGGYRVVSDQGLSPEEKNCIWEILGDEEEEAKLIIQNGCGFSLEKGKRPKPISWGDYRKDFAMFKKTVSLIEEMARFGFRSKRFDLEHGFSRRIRGMTYGREFHLPKQEAKFKSANRKCLEEMNSFCGYSSAVLMMYSKDRSSFHAYISTLEPWQEKRIQMFQLSPNLEKCFQWGKPIYIQPGLEMKKFEGESGINTKELSDDLTLVFPFASIKRCCLFPFTVDDRKWVFFFIYKQHVPPFEDFFNDNRRLMDTFCTQISHTISRAFAEMDRRNYLDRVAHETMNPIGKVKWHAEYIKMRYHEIEVGEVFRKLDDIINECNRAVRTAGTILRLSGKMKIELKPERVDFFRRIAQPIVHEMRHGREDLSIEFNRLKKMPILLVDFHSLYDVMFNILDNAVKYSSQGSTIIFSFEDHQDGVVLFVSNVGIGVPEDEDEKVFELGVRGSNASQTDVQGTGQGLAICKLIVEEKFRGKIWFERGASTPEGREVTFKVLLPKKFIAGGEYG